MLKTIFCDSAGMFVWKNDLVEGETTLWSDLFIFSVQVKYGITSNKL